MTPWIVDYFRRCLRICRLSFHVAKSFFNPFDPHFCHPLAYELWYLIIHEKEASAQMEETLMARSSVDGFAFADDLMLSDSPELVDDELEACLSAARGRKRRGSGNSSPSKVSFEICFIFL